LTFRGEGAIGRWLASVAGCDDGELVIKPGELEGNDDQVKDKEGKSNEGETKDLAASESSKEA